MAVFTRSTALVALATVVLAVVGGGAAAQQLSPTFYSNTCPNLAAIVRGEMAAAVRKEKRMGASILRLFFHDCFVNGCDASILLDDTATFTGEKAAGPNANSVRGYEVIDAIKAKVEASCSATVSCADILALASRDGVNLLGGPTWSVPLGRRDSRTASQSAANTNLPGPDSSLAQLVAVFGSKGLSPRDMTALSGAHTVGRAQCQNFRGRVRPGDSNIDPAFAKQRRRGCPQTGNDTLVSPFDVRTPDAFDNAYYQNLVEHKGLLRSDQELFNGGSQDGLVMQYKNSSVVFFADFVAAMVKMGGLMPSAGTPTEIRLNCRKAN